jgi:hypothetical protein
MQHQPIPVAVGQTPEPKEVLRNRLPQSKRVVNAS